MRGDSGLRREKALFGRVAEGCVVGATEPVSGGSVATEAEVARGRFGFTISCDEAGSDRGYRPK